MLGCRSHGVLNCGMQNKHHFDEQHHSRKNRPEHGRDEPSPNPRRLMVLLLFLVLAALPLVWFSLDPQAGDKLLYWMKVVGL